ncbi:50S ribosomal protein L4 [Candidatus Adlerbacteria bacterium RIFCSPLOWO2_01_FULL_51_16]|uniref:Large ribosomal subunit protein uL4 n=1 Tax=Candidatus Adlerbacteria bacterium RIFCSPLOWO2_01_FULL_51_16 TaxID=1797243 RepID=A0A1F4XHR8_9BACT|nr:MAG: 50S ribosomal protein L4 [Candidatus Adlerbacteria bacterium RIFCSPLOWO2_01_FULL_51_16]
MEAILYNIKGEKAGTVNLPENIFGLPWNADLVHQVVIGMQANARQGSAHAKTRGEVRGGGKKPWQQKGTGRARHGSSRSPIWKGGGVTHGPRKDKIYAKKINQKMRQKALLVSLSRKFKDGEILFVDSLELQEPKAKQARAVLAGLSKVFGALSAKKKNVALITLPRAHAATQKSFGNFGNVEVCEVRNLNPVSILGAKYLVMTNPQESLEILRKKQVIKQ